MMSPKDRASWRNIWLHEAATGNLLGGTYQNGSLTESNFLSAIDILVDNDEWTVVNRTSGRTVQCTASAIQPGIYDVHSQSPVDMTDEEWVPRIFSRSSSDQDTQFRDAVRRRDGGCMVSSVPNLRAQVNMWQAFEAVHLFPLEHESLWLSTGCKQWIANMNGVQQQGNRIIENSGINSVHNGLLMRSDLHREFDTYLFSINPDDGHKIMYFAPDTFGYDGETLNSVCRIPADPNRVCDELLRWHFRQSVLANMKGAGAPLFEHDFPPGSDMLGELRTEPHGRLQLELELFSRLRTVRNNEEVAAQDKSY